MEGTQPHEKRQKPAAYHCYALFLPFVRAEGLEPPSREAPDPKSGVSTNFTTPAFFGTAKVWFYTEKISCDKK
jgi:hypothetical protein